MPLSLPPFAAGTPHPRKTISGTGYANPPYQTREHLPGPDHAAPAGREWVVQPDRAAGAARATRVRTGYQGCLGAFEAAPTLLVNWSSALFSRLVGAGQRTRNGSRGRPPAS
ncbi:hypothetical protein Aca07nite_23880 [Actinoplanes capillaceus]|uniref:Uncharacterized protein n=1 Tax=Actinoplanes campanulatus TaxID=113559 RepID=A0ABQ3WFD6_9ACTN|nr:hypothetical protein Aca07nite_23880 [Actinoplanes capillaceus]